MVRHRQQDAVAKTNAMRELERAGIPYELRVYELEDEVSVGLGSRVAALTGLDPDACLKTIVCAGRPGSHAVFCIPVARELDLKKAARAAGEKSLSLLPVRELPNVTGYVRGGCSPIGLRRPLPTFIDETAELFDRVAVSGGRIGTQLLVSPEALASFVGASFVDLTENA